MTAPKLTEAQLWGLALVADGRDLGSFNLSDVRERCAHDALLWSTSALDRMGLIEWDRLVWRNGTCNGKHRITDAGRAALRGES